MTSTSSTQNSRRYTLGVSRAPTPVAIAADSPDTVAAGLQIAEAGGNAADIAVAAGMAAAVCEVLMASLGGSAFLMIGVGGAPPEVIDGSDTMPGLGGTPDPGETAIRDIHIPYGDGIVVRAGHGSIAVPGALAALDLAWRRHGSLPWAEIVAPTVTLARDGFRTSPTTARWLDLAGPLLFGQQAASSRSFFPDGRTPVAADAVLRIPDLGDALEHIARDGARTFYEGELAAAIADEITGHGGLVSRADLAAYEAVVRPALIARSRGFRLALNPPPAVGGTAVGLLIGLLETGWDERATPADRALFHARAQIRVLRTRDDELTPPGLDDGVAAALLAPDGIRRHLAAIRSPHTTHLSVSTGDGDVVAVTMSNGYGSGITVPGTGIPFNNSLGEPELNPLGYHVAPPGSRLVSNMAPTIADHEDGRRIALGSPGASRITTAVAQTWARLVLEGHDLAGAVAAPRMHVEEGEDGLRVQCEPGIDTTRLDEAFVVRPFEALHMYFGAVQAASVAAGGRLEAVADVRRHGAVGRVE